jgi:acyl dehydratase
MFLKKILPSLGSRRGALYSTLTSGAWVQEERKITSEDVEAFAKVTGDYNTVHFNSKGKSIVHGALLNGLVSGIIGTKIPGPGTILVSQNFSFPQPCFVGDTVIINVELKEVRKIIKCVYSVVCKESNNTVMDGEARLILKK